MAERDNEYLDDCVLLQNKYKLYTLPGCTLVLIRAIRLDDHPSAVTTLNIFEV
jgi:hypothetical protein